MTTLEISPWKVAEKGSTVSDVCDVAFLNALKTFAIVSPHLTLGNSFRNADYLIFSRKASKLTVDELVLRDSIINSIYQEYHRSPLNNSELNLFPSNIENEEADILFGLLEGKSKQLTGHKATSKSILEILLKLNIQDFMLLRKSRAFKVSFYHTSKNINSKINWTHVYYQITKKFVFNQPQFDKAYEINQSELVYTNIKKNVNLLIELLNIENVQVEPNLWEPNIVFQKSTILRAIELNDIKSIRILLDKCPNAVNYYTYILNYCDKDSINDPYISFFTTPLLYALSSNKLDIAMELIDRGANVNAKLHASNLLEETDYYNSAFSLLVSTKSTAPEMLILFKIFLATCDFIEPGLLGKIDDVSLGCLYLGRANQISIREISQKRVQRSVYMNCLRWLRIRLLFIGSLLDSNSVLNFIPFDVVNNIGKFFYQPNPSDINALVFPQKVLSPFWPHILENFKDRFSFLLK